MTSRHTTRAAPSVFRVGLARGRVEILQFFREKDSVVWTFSFPVILLAIFGSVFDEDIAPGVSFTQYFVAGMVASGLALTSFQSLAISIAIERDDGTLKRLAGTPMPPASYFAGKVLLVLLTSAAQLVLLLFVGVLVFGVDLPTTAWQWWTLAWVSLLGVTACTLCGVAYSSVPRSSKSAGATVAPVVLVLQFISGVFFVFSDLPGWMQKVASVFPLKWMAQGMRSVFLPSSFEAQEVSGSWQHGVTAAVLAAWVAAGLLLSLRTFRWTRERG